MQSFDMTKLFWSKARTKILEKFFLEYESWNNDWFYMRELSRDLDEQINSIKRELDSLEELKILKSKEISKKKIFYINKNFMLLDEFKSIFIKTYDPTQNIINFFKNQKWLELIIINDVLKNYANTSNNNIVDIFLIGEIDRVFFNNFLWKTFFNKKIKYAIISLEDYHKRVEYNDKLIFNIFKQSWNKFLKDTLWIEWKI